MTVRLINAEGVDTIRFDVGGEPYYLSMDEAYQLGMALVKTVRDRRRELKPPAPTREELYAQARAEWDERDRKKREAYAAWEELPPIYYKITRKKGTIFLPTKGDRMAESPRFQVGPWASSYWTRIAVMKRRAEKRGWTVELASPEERERYAKWDAELVAAQRKKADSAWDEITREFAIEEHSL